MSGFAPPLRVMCPRLALFADSFSAALLVSTALASNGRGAHVVHVVWQLSGYAARRQGNSAERRPGRRHFAVLRMLRLE